MHGSAHRRGSHVQRARHHRLGRERLPRRLDLRARVVGYQLRRRTERGPVHEQRSAVVCDGVAAGGDELRVQVYQEGDRRKRGVGE